MNKEETRKYALSIRNKLANESINNKIVNGLEEAIKKYNRIGIYYPIGSEINILNIIKKYPNKKFYLPITRDEISFIEYKLGDTLVDAKFKTKEPVGDITPRDMIECFIIPCVAISKTRQRLGYGKGYYDRYLKDYKGFKIGVIYKELNNLDFKSDSYDVYLDLVIEG
ncbi:MAG: 5-formyltetrahydrofolate cyclo-ligase [Acholeplasmatales bacterium]|nr:5-formyltetrahydrofolate cyclo-ligase [Acholeplasmatales bacterium]